MKQETIVFLPGQLIFREGEPGNSLYFIKDGKIEVFREKDGTEIRLGTMNAGDVLGTVTAFIKGPRAASARAISQVTCVVMSAEILDKGFRELPIWVQAVMKDAVARLKSVNDQLVEAKLQEKKLLRMVGTPLQHGSQLASLLAALARLGTVADDGVELFPLKGFLPRAESILNKRAEYLDLLLTAMGQAGVVKLEENKKFGLGVTAPKPALIDEFAVFAANVAKSGLGEFVPSKLYPWMSALVRIQKRNPEKDVWTPAEVSTHLAKEIGRSGPENLVNDFVQYGVLKHKSPNATEALVYQAAQVQRRIIFETGCRLFRDCKETEG